MSLSPTRVFVLGLLLLLLLAAVATQSEDSDQPAPKQKFSFFLLGPKLQTQNTRGRIINLTQPESRATK